jgi:D-alanyl-D-alanine carboxypeptidase (penicillin-binding protein 5/6)
VVILGLLLPGAAQAKQFRVNTRSAILIDMTHGDVLFEQNADSLIPPASITKVLSLYLVFEAMEQGRVHSWDRVLISTRAANAPPSRMGVKAGEWVTLQELIKGMAVVSGNDASIAVAEHVGGSVENFVRMMNVKARQLGMTSSAFMTPNGLPAKGQLTTARDISKLSTAYLRRFPESLALHSMQSYTYNNRARHNANRLLGKCPGVDGLKTGFVCASGYNLSATARRDGVRMLAVVLGAQSPGIRSAETTKLLEMGFKSVGGDTPEVRQVRVGRDADEEAQCEPPKKLKTKGATRAMASTAGAKRSGKVSKSSSSSKSKASTSRAAVGAKASARVASTQGKGSVKTETAAAKQGAASKVAKAGAKARQSPAIQSKTGTKTRPAASTKVAASKGSSSKTTVAKQQVAKTGSGTASAKDAKSSGKTTVAGKSNQTSSSLKQSVSTKSKPAVQPAAKKGPAVQKLNSQVHEPKKNKG